MGAEIYNVNINLDGFIFEYATKCDFKRNKSDNTVTTFNGDVTTGSLATGATISFEGLVLPKTVKHAIKLEKLMNKKKLKKIVVSGTSFTAGGAPYKRRIIGTGVTVTSDEESWSPTDGTSDSFEVKVDNLIKEFIEP